ncbi:MAG: HAMP domain-containing histidine kinase [Acidimicrobiia bacterium]|nr:HAMP domain-containing histidine kinase [Acidimicrobiia bacterium]
MSLRSRIMGSIVLVIVLTIVVGVGIAYYTTQARLDVFVDRIGREEASRLARNLGREYAAAGGWETVERPLSEAGYIIDGPPPSEGSGEGEHGSEESFHHDPVRVVVTDADGRVVRDTLSELAPGTLAPDLAGRSETVFDPTGGLSVGRVYVDVGHDFLSTESHGFLNTVLSIILAGGALTAAVGILLAAWLSKRITAPVTALTEATQAIAQGDTTRLPVTSSDELGRMSAAFNRMTSALESQRKLRRRLISDVSHELNTPLSVIQLEAQGLRDGLQTPEDAADHIIGEVDRLRGLVTDLDWLAETDHGELRVTFQPCSVREFLGAEVDRWRPRFQARQVELSLRASPDLPQVDMDRVRMSQALGNVLSNAARCTEAGGRVAIEAGTESNGWLDIVIIDNGIGIYADDLPHVFDRFYRTDSSRSRGIGGTGLGLSITRAVILAHGGTVTVTSDGPGRGTTVTVRLPANGPEPGRTEPSPVSGPG